MQPIVEARKTAVEKNMDSANAILDFNDAKARSQEKENFLKYCDREMAVKVKKAYENLQNSKKELDVVAGLYMSLNRDWEYDETKCNGVLDCCRALTVKWGIWTLLERPIKEVQ